MPTKKKTAPQKPAASKATAKKAPAKKPVAKKAAAKKAPAKKPVAKQTAAKKAPGKKAPAKKAAAKDVVRRSALGFRGNEHIVYPAHGVGLIVEISAQEIAGMSLELFVINFEKEKMVLRVPIDKAEQTGMRKLADNKVMDGAIRTLKGRARIKLSLIHI